MTERFHDRQVAFREAEIVRAARELLDEVGCRRFTMDAVAGRLGLSKGTLYRHFESREALLSRVVRDGWERVAEEAHRRRAAAPPGRELSVVMDFLVRCFLGLDGSSPCCLEEVRCPFLGPQDLGAPLRPLGSGSGAELGLPETVRALAASIRARRRAHGALPTEDDARAVVAVLLPAG